MSNRRSLKILLVVLSLAFWTGTANATAPSNFTATQGGLTVQQESLIYVVGGQPTDPQTLATQTINISLSNSDASDAYTVSTTGWPGWLTPLTGQTVSAGSPVSVNLVVNKNGLPVPISYPATYTYTILFQQSGFANLTMKITLSLLTSPLALGGSVSQFTALGGNLMAPQTFPMGLASLDYSPATFALDPATVPSWLNVTQGAQNANTTTGSPGTSASIVFTLDPNVTPALSPGIYTANVGFTVAAFGEYFVPVSLAVSNPSPSLLLKEGVDGAEADASWSAGMTIPIPTVTPYSSNEPVPFNATCTIAVTYGTSPNSCVASPSSGVAYSWGSSVTVPGLLKSYFNGVPLGNTVTVTITITPAIGSNTTPTTITFKYTLVPIAANIVSASPSAIAPLTSSAYSTVVLLTGTGFVSPTNIASGSGLGPTKVWLGSTAVSGVVVMSTTLMAVTIPANAMPTIPPGSTSTTLDIGVANYAGTTAPNGPSSTYTLTITNGPVVYGLTSTATYKQPTPGNSPNVAAYELVSIFGANFMSSTTLSAGVSGVLDSYNKVPTTLAVSGSGASAVTLTVTFAIGSGKTVATYPAPVLFANPTQINAIVPSGMAIGSVATVTVTTAGSTTNPLPVNVVTADPGIYTMASDGAGPGAILNIVTTPVTGVVTTTVNSAANKAIAGETLAIYATGLGAPDSTGADAVTNKSTLFPSACVAISNTTKGTPGYLQVVNTAATGYVSPKWTTIDGAVISYGPNTLLGGLPPCMTSAVSVVIGNPGQTLTLSGNSIGYAGFVAGAAAGLYQINATLPSTMTFSDGSSPISGTAYPIQIIIGAFSSPTTATVQF